jgi:hypothetical protein
MERKGSVGFLRVLSQDVSCGRNQLFEGASVREDAKNGGSEKKVKRSIRIVGKSVKLVPRTLNSETIETVVESVSQRH